MEVVYTICDGNGARSWGTENDNFEKGSFEARNATEAIRKLAEIYMDNDVFCDYDNYDEWLSLYRECAALPTEDLRDEFCEEHDFIPSKYPVEENGWGGFTDWHDGIDLGDGSAFFTHVEVEGDGGVYVDLCMDCYNNCEDDYED